MNEEIKVIEAINEEGAVEAVIEEVVASNGFPWKKVAMGLGLTGLTAGLAYGVYKGVKFIKTKKAAKVEAEIEEIEE